MKTSRLPALDGLRGIAILAVLLFHFGEAFQKRAGTIAGTVLARGWMGVDLFFVLSGFLITGILLNTKRAENYYASFYFRRFLRIFPLYYGFLALWFLVLVPLAGASHAGFTGAEHGRWFWLYVSNWPGAPDVPPLGHLWSLAIEEQFYLVWPFVVALLTPRQLGRACVGIVLGSLALRTAFVWQGASVDTIWHFTPMRVDTLALGALLAVVASDPNGVRDAAAWLKQRRVLLAAVGALVLFVLVRSRLLRFGNPWTLTLGFPVIGLAAVCAVAANLDDPARPSAMRRFLEWGPLRSLGKYSYGMYVLHFPLHIALMHWSDRNEAVGRLVLNPVFDWAYLVGGVLVTYGLAWVSWNVFEQHFIRLKDGFGAKTRAPVVPAAKDLRSSQNPL